MNIYTQKQRWKIFLMVSALIIGITSLWYTNKLVKNLADEERQRIQLWAEATKKLVQTDINMDLSFVSDVVKNNTTIPVIMTDEKFHITSYRNLDSVKALDSTFLYKELETMRAQHEPIEINLEFPPDLKIRQYIFYKDSDLLVKLRYYPFFQLAVIALFLFVSYLAFSNSRRAEQNQVWVGMAKETAHQLGTPLSSLMAWVDFLKLKGASEDYTKEIEKDISRLSTITERFSKIGSAPSLQRENILEVLQHSVNYIQTRSSDKVTFTLAAAQNKEIFTPINVPLFEWVIENVLKNAIDAMSGAGAINILITDQQQFAYIDISDTGKGIPKSSFKTIFKPGFTTKNLGWGLGLSLSKRIIEEYHDGRIFVRNSETGKGTTFRIVLKK